MLIFRGVTNMTSVSMKSPFSTPSPTHLHLKVPIVLKDTFQDPIELKEMPGTRMLFSSCDKEASIDVGELSSNLIRGEPSFLSKKCDICC